MLEHERGSLVDHAFDTRDAVQHQVSQGVGVLDAEVDENVIDAREHEHRKRLGKRPELLNHLVHDGGGLGSQADCDHCLDRSAEGLQVSGGVITGDDTPLL